MLKLSRHKQQTIVVNPRGQRDKPLVIMVCELLPGTVGLGFDGNDYEIVRGEKYDEGKSYGY